MLDKFVTRNYEVKNHICVTPCKWKHKPDGSDIYIGSAFCKKCTSFRNIDKEKQTVLCRYKNIFV